MSIITYNENEKGLQEICNYVDKGIASRAKNSIENLRLGVYRALSNPGDLDDWWWADCKDLPLTFGKIYSSLIIRNKNPELLIKTGWKINSRERELTDLDQSDKVITRCIELLGRNNIF